MNADELKESWLEAENLITLIDPQFEELGGVIHKPDEPSAGDLKKVLQFLRVEIRSMLHKNESLSREKLGLLRFIQSKGQGTMIGGNEEVS